LLIYVNTMAIAKGSSAEPYVVYDIEAGEVSEDGGFSFGSIARHLLSITVVKRHT
jgi:hypothetical protein